MDKTCKHGFDHSKLGVPCTACRLDMYEEDKSMFAVFEEIEKIQVEENNEL